MPELTRALLDYSRFPVLGVIADAVHMALSFCPHLHPARDGDAITARTEFRRYPALGAKHTHVFLRPITWIPYPAHRCRLAGYRAVHGA